MAKTWEAQCDTSADLALLRFWELEQGQVTDVQGKLKAHLSFWLGAQIIASPMDH